MVRLCGPFFRSGPRVRGLSRGHRNVTCFPSLVSPVFRHADIPRHGQRSKSIFFNGKARGWVNACMYAYFADGRIGVRHHWPHGRVPDVLQTAQNLTGVVHWNGRLRLVSRRNVVRNTGNTDVFFQ